MKSDRERQISYDTTRIWNLIKKLTLITNELIYKTETDLQVLKTKLWTPKGKVGVRDKLGIW